MADRMSFLQKRVGTTSGGFGETLREVRELRGYSINMLAKMSGIHPLIVQALEEERLEDLADPVYAERHVRALASALESTSVYLLEKYRALLDARGVPRSHALFPGARLRMTDLFVRPRAVAFAGFLCVALLLSAYVFWQASILSSVPKLVVDSPVEGAVSSAPRLRVTGMTDAGAFVNVNGVNAVVDPSGAYSIQLDIPRGVSVIRIEARRRYGTSAVVERHVSYVSTSTRATQP